MSWYDTIVKPIALEWFATSLDMRHPFQFVRWGDGEFLAIFQKREGRSTHGQYFYPALSDALRRTLASRPPYMLGLPEHAWKRFGATLEQFFAEHGLAKLDWYPANVLCKPMMRQNRWPQMVPLLSALRRRRPLVIGPNYMRQPISTLLDAAGFVAIPEFKMFERFDAIKSAVFQQLLRLPDDQVITCSCGLPGKVLMHRVWERFPKVTILDMGSTWDLFAGVKTRAYMEKFDPDAALPQPEGLPVATASC